MAMLGKLVHYGVDAVLLSTVLAGIRRSSGFTCVVSLGLLVSILTVSSYLLMYAAVTCSITFTIAV